MGITMWTIDGYGFSVTDAIKDKADFACRILALIDKTPDLKDLFDDYLEANDIKTPDYDTIEEFGMNTCNSCVGISSVIRGIIERHENIELKECLSSNQEEYLLFEPAYPWTMNECHRNFTEEDVQAIYNKYMKQLTDEPIYLSYFSVET